MGLQPVKTSVGTGIPVFQKVYETAQGGFILDTTGLVLGSTLKAGQPMSFNEATRKAQVLKVAELHANAANNATTYQVKKGHGLAVGEHFGAAVGGSAQTITAINTSNADYDVLTVGTTLGVALTAGDVVFQSSAAGASAGAFAAEPRGLLYEDLVVAAGADLAVVLRATVYERRVPKAGAAVKAKLPNIIYSQSY